MAVARYQQLTTLLPPLPQAPRTFTLTGTWGPFMLPIGLLSAHVYTQGGTSPDCLRPPRLPPPIAMVSTGLHRDRAGSRPSSADAAARGRLGRGQHQGERAQHVLPEDRGRAARPVCAHPHCWHVSLCHLARAAVPPHLASAAQVPPSLCSGSPSQAIGRRVASRLCAWCPTPVS